MAINTPVPIETVRLDQYLKEIAPNALHLYLTPAELQRQLHLVALHTLLSCLLPLVIHKTFCMLKQARRMQDSYLG